MRLPYTFAVNGKKTFLICFLTLSLLLSLGAGHACLASAPHLPSCNGAGNTSHNHGNGAPQKCYLCDGEMDRCDGSRFEQDGPGLIGQAFSLSQAPLPAVVTGVTGAAFDGPSTGTREAVSAPRVASSPIYLNNLSLLC